jgi:cytochrome c-type biogenesis protein CcmH/NrfG
LNKENLAFLVGGLAFGFLLGYAVFSAVQSEPQLASGPTAAATQPAQQASPAGPRSPSQVGPSGADGGAPMMREINALKQMLQENPQNVAALTRLANIYHDAAMWDQAVGYYLRAIEITPGDPDLITDLGICYRGQRKFDEALAQFDRAQEINPDHWQSLFNTVIVAGFDVGQYDRAEAALQRMEAMQPQPPKTSELRDAIRKARAEKAGQG